MPKIREVLVSSVVVGLVACGSGDGRLIGRFFQALESGEEATLYALSRVRFPGNPESWEIVNVGPESTVPYQVPELSRKVEEAQRDVSYHSDKFGLFVSDNQVAYDEYQSLLKKDSELKATDKLGEFQEEVENFQKEAERLEQISQSAAHERDVERSAAGLSLMGASGIDDLDGEVLSKEVLVKVKTREAGEKTYVFDLRHYDLFNKTNNGKPRSRWIIAGIREEGTPSVPTAKKPT